MSPVSALSSDAARSSHNITGAVYFRVSGELRQGKISLQEDILIGKISFQRGFGEIASEYFCHDPALQKHCLCWRYLWC